MKSTRHSWLRRIVETEAHHRLTIGLVVGGLAYGAVFRRTSFSASLITGWDAFAVACLALAWLGMFFTDAKTRVREAHLQDSSRVAICVCVVLASLAGLVGAGVLLGAVKAGTSTSPAGSVALAALTVVASWFLVHTVMALHYTHVFYCACENSLGRNRIRGLTFPGEKEPDYLDFAYFSFVIGMTCQVSDVQVVSSQVRRVVLLHGLLSFGFNTVILAFSINLASGLL